MFNRNPYETLNKAYPDDFLALQHAEFSNDLETLSLTEALAAYVVRETEELYDPNASERQNAVRTAPSLARSANVLQQLAEVLRQESKANSPRFFLAQFSSSKIY